MNVSNVRRGQRVIFKAEFSDDGDAETVFLAVEDSSAARSGGPRVEVVALLGLKINPRQIVDLSQIERVEDYAPDTSHLVALHEGLSRERARLAAATNESERALRATWIAQREREIAAELQLLGMSDIPQEVAALSDAELLASLKA